MNKFDKEMQQRLETNGENVGLMRSAEEFMRVSYSPKYSYNFSWLGRPIIQYPQDIVALQELIWATRPDLIIETGIAHGGSLILNASMLALLDISDEIELGTGFERQSNPRQVLGIDIDIRDHNKREIESHPMFSRIKTIQGSSIAPETISEVLSITSGYERILVCLDSNHTHEHVLSELEAYAVLTTVGSYCIVFDTLIDHLPEQFFPNRPWGAGNNPNTAVSEFLKNHPEFEADKKMDHKLLISAAPGGYLKRIK